MNTITEINGDALEAVLNGGRVFWHNTTPEQKFIVIARKIPLPGQNISIFRGSGFILCIATKNTPFVIRKYYDGNSFEVYKAVTKIWNAALKKESSNKQHFT